MKCRILLLASVLSLTSAVSVDPIYYPHHDPHHHPHHDPHHHPHYSPHYAPHYAPHRHAHVKYIEPSHVKAVKYIHPASVPAVGPVYKQIPAAPYKYIHSEPHQHYAKHADYDEPAHYEYGYDVHDPHTGDVKSHSEKRDGDAVHGKYEVLDPDGFKRIVEYTADDQNGFNAVVRREPADVKVIKKVYEPEYVKHIAPLEPVKYYTQQPQAIIPPPTKLYAPPVHQKIIAPIVKQFVAPQYYAPPEHPKYFKPVRKIPKFVKPAYGYEPHTSIKYVQPAPHYNHY